MKPPLATVDSLLLQGSPEERSGASGRAVGILKRLGAEEQARRDAAAEPPLNRWNVVTDDGRCVAPQIYAWATGDDELLRHIPSPEVCDLLGGTSQVTLHIPLIQEQGVRLRRNVVIGTRAALLASELMKEARLVGLVNEKDKLDFEMKQVLEPVLEAGADKVMILGPRELDREYLSAKRELAKTAGGREVLRVLAPYRVTSGSDKWRRMLGLPSLY